VPRDAWFFAENGHATLPWCVFLEVGLQPCGWLAMATGAPREFPEDLRFRNLDGSATWTREGRSGRRHAAHARPAEGTSRARRAW
jgi:hypothetical protein